MNSGNWGGSNTEPAQATWEVETTLKLPKTLDVTIQIPANSQAPHVARLLTLAWNEKYPDGPHAAADGTLVHFAGLINAFRVNGVQLPQNGSAIEVSPGLFVYMS
jgi:hypothetical protein